MEKIDADNLPCIRVLSIYRRSFFVVPKPFQARESQQFGLLWEIEDPAIIKMLLCLDSQIKWQHSQGLLRIVHAPQGVWWRTGVCWTLCEATHTSSTSVCLSWHKRRTFYARRQDSALINFQPNHRFFSIRFAVTEAALVFSMEFRRWFKLAGKQRRRNKKRIPTMPLVSHLLRQRGLEPLTYCLEGAIWGLSIANRINHIILKNKELKEN